MPDDKELLTSGPAEALKTIAGMQGAGPSAVARMYVTWLEGIGDLGSEAFQFVSERINEDVKVQHEILHCKNPADLLSIQRRFLQTALDQYVEEGGKLMKLSNDIVQAAFETPKK